MTPKHAPAGFVFEPWLPRYAIGRALERAITASRNYPDSDAKYIIAFSLAEALHWTYLFDQVDKSLRQPSSPRLGLLKGSRARARRAYLKGLCAARNQTIHSGHLPITWGDKTTSIPATWLTEPLDEVGNNAENEAYQKYMAGKPVLPAFMSAIRTIGATQVIHQRAERIMLGFILKAQRSNLFKAPRP